MQTQISPERLDAYRKTFGRMSTDALSAIIQGQKPHHLSAESLRAIGLLLAERSGARSRAPAAPNPPATHTPQMLPRDSASEIEFSPLPPHVLTVRQFLATYEQECRARKRRNIFKDDVFERRSAFQIGPDFSRKVQRRVDEILAGTSAVPLAYGKSVHTGDEIVLLEDSIIVTPKPGFWRVKHEPTRLRFRDIRKVEWKLPFGTLHLDQHAACGIPPTVAHWFAQFIVRLSSASYNVASHEQTRKLRAGFRGADADLFEKWRASLVSVLPRRATGGIGSGDISATAFAGISWQNIADVHTHAINDAMDAISSLNEGRKGTLTILTVDGELKQFTTLAKNLSALEACIREIVGMGGPGEARALAAVDPRQLLESGKSKSRALGFSMVGLSITFVTIFASFGDALNSANSGFGNMFFMLGVVGFFAGLWRVIRP